MFCVLDVLGFRRFCFGHILDVLGLDVLGLDVLVLDVLGEHGKVVSVKISLFLISFLSQDKIKVYTQAMKINYRLKKLIPSLLCNRNPIVKIKISSEKKELQIAICY